MMVPVRAVAASPVAGLTVATRPESVLEVVPMTRVAVGPLLQLFAEERARWLSGLLWDASELGEAVDIAARAHLLPGHVVLLAGRPVAHLLVHVGPEVIRPCGVHVRPATPTAAVHALVDTALDALPEDRRLEAQLTAFEHQPALDDAFRARGVQVTPRTWLVGRLDELARRASASPGLADLQPGWPEALAPVLVASHAATVEARINAAFRTVEDARDYLEELGRGVGCGRLLGACCRVALGSGGAVEGFCLVTSVGPGVAHVPQVAVAPRAQGRGLGRLLLSSVARELAARGFSRVTLSVSLENVRAREWYERWGFTTLAPLSAYHRPPA